MGIFNELNTAYKSPLREKQDLVHIISIPKCIVGPPISPSWLEGHKALQQLQQLGFPREASSHPPRMNE